MTANRIQAIVTDIEGTTSALSFVKDVLFPYAKIRLADYVHQHVSQPDVRAALDEVRRLEANQALTTEEIIAILLQWSAEDKKIGPLKALQGMIWEAGYVSGAFTTHMYEDAVVGLKKWHAAGLPLYIYSSGSVQAQKLLFRYTAHGDLTPLFSGYFDTTTGGKLEAASYTKIAAAIGQSPRNILFLSDHVGELDAAQNAGFQVVLLDRDHAFAEHRQHPRVTEFSTIALAETV